MPRRRCAEPQCRHAPRAHSITGCALCPCTSWLETKPHTWRSDVTDAWFMATHAWSLHAEAATNGFTTELAEFEANHPRPRLVDFMHAMSPGAPPESLAALIERQVCSMCLGTGVPRDDDRRSA